MLAVNDLFAQIKYSKIIINFQTAWWGGKMTDQPETQPTFQRLREILSAFETHLVLTQNEMHIYSLDTKCPYRGKPLFFGAVRQGKQDVSFHLMPVYIFPDLLAQSSPELMKHLKGKSCFHFNRSDEHLLRELADLVKSSFERLNKEGMA
jgi:hypothetical protein